MILFFIFHSADKEPTLSPIGKAFLKHHSPLEQVSEVGGGKADDAGDEEEEEEEEEDVPSKKKRKKAPVKPQSKAPLKVT